MINERIARLIAHFAGGGNKRKKIQMVNLASTDLKILLVRGKENCL